MTGDTNGRRRILVTGAARGLGREIAFQLAGRGCAVAICDIDEDGLGETANAIRELGGPLLALVADLSSEREPERIVRDVVDHWSGIDVLVNNAAYSRIEPFLETTAATWQRVFAVNVFAVALACRTAASVMKRQGGGRIVNVTSPSARMAIPEYVAYSASKAAVDSITRSLAAALGPHSILVNGISPGMIDTDIQRETEVELARLQSRQDVEAFREERTRRIPIGRRPTLAETASAVVWLCLDAPDYMTAERLNMSGGLEKD